MHPPTIIFLSHNKKILIIIKLMIIAQVFLIILKEAKSILPVRRQSEEVPLFISKEEI